jgi:hypothetical protein
VTVWPQDAGARGEDAGEAGQQAVVANVGEVPRSSALMISMVADRLCGTMPMMTRAKAVPLL